MNTLVMHFFVSMTFVSFTTGYTNIFMFFSVFLVIELFRLSNFQGRDTKLERFLGYKSIFQEKTIVFCVAASCQKVQKSDF